MNKDKVLLVTVDSLRKDKFSESYFPNSYGYFEEDFFLFENAYSHGVATPLAFPGIISGSLATENGELPDEIPTIAELASGTSIGMNNNAHLLPYRGYNRGFDEYGRGDSDTILNKIKEFGRRSKIARDLYRKISPHMNNGNELPYIMAEDVVDNILKNIDSDMSLMWAHFMDPHYPFLPLNDKDKMYDEDHVERLNNEYGENTLSNKEILELESLYEDNIRYFDVWLSTLFSSLKEKGIYDNLMIIFLSDHGEAFRDNGIESHQWDADPIDALIRTPLAIKYPNKPNAKLITHNVKHSDVYACIADFFGNENKSNGINPLVDKERHIISKSNAAKRIITSTGSMIMRRDGSTLIEGEITDSAKEKLDSEPFPQIETHAGDIPGLTSEESEEVEERLSALGYK